MLKRFSPLIFFAIAALFAACTGCKSDKPQGPQPTAFEQKMVAKDTSDVEHEIATFFSNIEQKKYYDAVAMLYSRRNKDVDAEPLSNEEMDRLVKVYKQLPYVGYKVDYVKFLSPTENEVSCKVIMQKGHDGLPDATTQFFFTPIKRGDKWLLILTDNIYHSEETVTEFEQRDSLKDRYDNYKKTHK